MTSHPSGRCGKHREVAVDSGTGRVDGSPEPERGWQSPPPPSPRPSAAQPLYAEPPVPAPEQVDDTPVPQISWNPSPAQPPAPVSPTLAPPVPASALAPRMEHPSITVAWVLTLTLGLWGADRFYLGYLGRGLARIGFCIALPILIIAATPSGVSMVLWPLLSIGVLLSLLRTLSRTRLGQEHSRSGRELGGVVPTWMRPATIAVAVITFVTIGMLTLLAIVGIAGLL